MDLRGGSVIRLIWSPVVLPALFGNWLQNNKRMAQKNGDKMINNERTCSLFQPETCTCCSSVVYEKSVRRCAAVTSEISWLLNVKKLLSFIMKLPYMFSFVCTLLPRGSLVIHLTCRMLRGHMQLSTGSPIIEEQFWQMFIWYICFISFDHFFGGKTSATHVSGATAKEASRLAFVSRYATSYASEAGVKSRFRQLKPKLILDENHQPFLEVSNYIYKHM